MPKKKIEDINEENYNDGVEEQIIEFVNDAGFVMDSIKKYGGNYEENVDDYIFDILETAFIMLFHERDLPLELIDAVFHEHPEYCERLQNVVIGSIMDKMTKETGDLIEVKDDNGKYEGHMLKSKYDQIIGDSE